MPANINTVLAVFFGLVLLVVLFRAFYVPLKWGVRFLLNFGVGIVMVAVFNLVGGFFAFTVPLNAITATSAGFLGFPGLLLVIAVQRMLL